MSTEGIVEFKFFLFCHKCGKQLEFKTARYSTHEFSLIVKGCQKCKPSKFRKALALFQKRRSKSEKTKF